MVKRCPRCDTWMAANRTLCRDCEQPKFRISVKGQLVEAHDAAKVRGCGSIRMVACKSNTTIFTVEAPLLVLVEWFCETDLLEAYRTIETHRWLDSSLPEGTLLFYQPEGNYVDRMFDDVPTTGPGGVDSIPLVMAKPVGFCHCQWPCTH